MSIAAPIKIALVTGANKGIGKEIAKGLLENGFHVLVGARNKELGEATVADLGKYGKVSFQQLDVTDPKSVSAAADDVKSQFGHLDVLVGLACLVPSTVCRATVVCCCSARCRPITIDIQLRHYLYQYWYQLVSEC